LEFSNSIMAPPTDPKDLAAHKLKDKARRIILDRVKDHLIPHLSGKTTCQGHVGGSEELVLEQEQESQNGVEREAQGYEDDKVRYYEDLSHPDLTGSR
jgi:hypothetical protein